MCEGVCVQDGEELAPFSGQRGWYMEEGRGAEPQRSNQIMSSLWREHILGMLHHLLEMWIPICKIGTSGQIISSVSVALSLMLQRVVWMVMK